MFSQSDFEVEFPGDSLSQLVVDWSKEFGNDPETTASGAAQGTSIECSFSIELSLDNAEDFQVRDREQSAGSGQKTHKKGPILTG